MQTQLTQKHLNRASAKRLHDICLGKRIYSWVKIIHVLMFRVSCRYIVCAISVCIHYIECVCVCFGFTPFQRLADVSIIVIVQHNYCTNVFLIHFLFCLKRMSGMKVKTLSLCRPPLYLLFTLYLPFPISVAAALVGFIISLRNNIKPVIFYGFAALLSW